MRNSDPKTHNEPSKHRQHHVWQEYLRGWATDGGLFCLQNGNVFPTGTKRVAMQKDFYKLQDLTEQDMQILFMFSEISAKHPMLREFHQLVLLQLAPVIFVRRNRANLRNLKRIDEHLDRYRTNVIENFHMRVEGDFLPVLQCIRAGCSTWYNDDRLCLNFLVFICIQYMRTRGIKERMVQGLRQSLNLDYGRVWDILSIMSAFNIALALFSERKGRKLLFIKNDTAVSFITGDQPVINLHGFVSGLPQKLSLYYPLSPSLALCLSEYNEPPPLPVDAMTAEVVMELNCMVKSASHKQLFAQTRDALIDLECP